MTVYKYVRPERLDIIQNLELRFTQPGALNDLFELRPRFETLMAEAIALAELNEAPPDLTRMLREAYSMLPDHQRAHIPLETMEQYVGTYMATDEARQATAATLVAILLSFRLGAPGLCNSIYDVLNHRVGILSLSEVPDNVLMWAHYSDNHRGMLLAFDERHRFFNRRRSNSDEFYHLRQVRYSSAPPVPDLLSLDGDMLFVTKGLQWAYEREWRMLAPLTEASRSLTVAEDVVHLYSFPPEALLGIAVGAKASPTLERSVREVLRTRPELAHVTVVSATLDQGLQGIRVDLP